MRKKEVDNYLPGKRIPHCELEVHPLGEAVSRLIHKVTLLGAKPPCNVFTLSYMPPKLVQEGMLSTISINVCVASGNIL